MNDIKDFKKFTLDEIKLIISGKQKLDTDKMTTRGKIQQSYPSIPNQSPESRYIDNIKEIVYTKLNITMESGKPNIDAIRNSSNGSMEINEGEYTYSYVISDIHADFRKFMMILMRANIISLYNPKTDQIQTDSMIQYHLEQIVKDHMYIYRLVSTYDIAFKEKSTNLIILGDLVDGKRPYYDNDADDPNVFGEIYDKLGLFELLIHIILYNLRLSGQTSRSTVTIILGNHEIMTLFNNSYTIGHDYVDAATINTFTSYSMRSDILIPFYLFNPCIFQIIKKPFGIRAILSHGSFSGERQNFSNITLINLLKYSDTIRNILFDSFINEQKIIKTRATKTDLNSLNDLDFINSVIWSRYFPKMFLEGTSELDVHPTVEESGCVQIASIPNIDFFIMGHCTTAAFINKRLDNIQFDNKEYNYCTGYKDCVFVGCLNPNEYGINFPKLIIVDNAISYANSVQFDNNDMDDEINHSIVSTHSIRVEDTKHSRYIDRHRSFAPYNVYTYNDVQFTKMTVQFAEILLLKFDSNITDNANPYEFYRIRTSFDTSTGPLLYYLINLNVPSVFPKSTPVRNPLIGQSSSFQNPLIGQSSSFQNPMLNRSVPTHTAGYYDKYNMNKDNYISLYI